MKRKRKDVVIEPEKKYNRVLYTSRRRNFSEEDITPTSQTSRIPRVRKPVKKGNFITDSANALITKLGIKQSIKSSQLGNGDKKSKKRGQNPFKDGFIRTTLIACVIVVGVSAIAIPTSFARKTTSIKVNDNGRVFESNTVALTVGEFLKENQIEVSEDDILETSIATPIQEGMEIVIRRAMPITIRTQDGELSIEMIAGTVADALAKANVTPAPEDEIYPSTETFTRPEMVIDHIKVETKEVSEFREIPFKKTEREDKTLAKGSTKIAQHGENGELEIIFKQVYKNGMLISEEVVGEEVVREPITEITAVGTYVKPKPKPKPAAKSGGGGGGGGKQPVVDGSGRYVLTVTATAYCAECNSGGKTSTGTYPQRGTIAANPSILPYGTIIDIPGYGTGRIEDTGGFARSNPYAIDVFMDSHDQCYAWGRKSVQITIH